jgi:Ni/Fe-hydrogenase 1 B-type cytochrome subunit
MFRKKQSLSLRIWHWLNALVVTFLLLSVLLRDTIFDVNKNKFLILEHAKSTGQNLTSEQASGFAKVILNHFWEWHPIIGFVAIALLGFRTIIFFINRKNAVKLIGEKKPLHYKIVQWSYKLFYLLLALMGLTGVLMYRDDFFHLSNDRVHTIQDVHETIMWFIIAFIVAHITGVVKAEYGEDKGIVSDMINGG